MCQNGVTCLPADCLIEDNRIRHKLYNLCCRFRAELTYSFLQSFFCFNLLQTCGIQCKTGIGQLISQFYQRILIPVINHENEFY
jgi:hypothetical protein